MKRPKQATNDLWVTFNWKKNFRLFRCDHFFCKLISKFVENSMPDVCFISHSYILNLYGLDTNIHIALFQFIKVIAIVVISLALQHHH